MPHPLEAGTIRILKSDGSTAGTGFLVSKRLAVTCAHLVEDAAVCQGDVVKFKFHLGDLEAQEAKVLENGWSRENDVVILELTEKPPKWVRPIIMQSSQNMEGRSFQGLGYPDDAHVQTRWPQGNISGRVKADGYANPLLQIQGKEIDKGLSGSAIVDRETRRVVGMITAYQDISRPNAAENVRFGYAIPIETFWKVYPELEKELPSLPKRSPLVEGIQLLPNGYDFRIQNFLTEYLGSPEQPEPFGGREDLFKVLDKWLESDKQRLLLAAPAGRGKSALLVRWLHRLLAREDLALVFVPISVRFRTNLASMFFASLAARLAYLHGEQLPTGLETSIDVWRGLASTYLHKQLIDKRKLVIVLDGLDEAGDWEAAADLIPAELPENVRVVVSTRFLSGDLDAQPWLSRLGWEHPGKALTLDLHPLDFSGVTDVLLRMGIPLDELSRRVDIVAELHRLSEGDPLLVNVYVEDLWSRGQQVSRLQPEDLHTITPGYEGYFSRWWNDQKKLWGGNALNREKTVKLVFNLLCGGMGGLTTSDLMALDLEDELDTQIIEEALDTLKRFVIGIPSDGREQKIGYVLTHPKLSQYFWDKLTEKERNEFESRFVLWGENIMKSLIDKKLQHNQIPRYLLQYYGAHLGRTAAPVEKYLPFVDYPYWHQAWFDDEGTYDGYLQDLTRTWKVCSNINKQELHSAGVASLLGKEIRCALIKASIFGWQIPPDLLAQLVLSNLWTPNQALVYAGQIKNPVQFAKIMTALIPALPDANLSDVLSMTRKFQDATSHAEILNELAKRLPDTQRNLLLTDAVSNTTQIKNPSDRAIAMSYLSLQLPEEQKESIFVDALLTLSEEISDYERSKALNIMLKNVSPILKDEVVTEILAIVSRIENDSRSYVLCEMIWKISPKRLEDLRLIADGIENDIDRYRVLLAIDAATMQSTKLDELFVSILKIIKKLGGALFVEGIFVEAIRSLTKRDLSPDLIEKIFTATQALKGNSYRADVIEFLIPKLPQKLFNDVLNIIRQTNDEWVRSEILRCSAKYLPTDLLDEALSIAQALPHDNSQAEALTALARRLPEVRQESVLRDALFAARQINDKMFHVQILAELIRGLSKSQKGKAFDHVLALSNKALGTAEILARHLPEEMLITVLSLAQDIPDESSRYSTLIAIIERSPELSVHQILKQIYSMQNEELRALLLGSLLPRIHVDEKQDVINSILTLALKSKDPMRAAQILSNLANKLPMDQREYVLVSALQAIQATDSDYSRAIALNSLPDQLPQHQLSKALSISWGIEKDNTRVLALSGFVGQVSDEMLTRIMSEVEKVTGQALYPNILMVLAQHIPTGIHDFILSIARETTDTETRAILLSALVNRLPEGQWQTFVKEALSSACEMRGEISRSGVLNSIVEKLVLLDRSVGYELWYDTLITIASNSRGELFDDLVALMPFALHLANDNLPTEIYFAIEDVTNWWP